MEFPVEKVVCKICEHPINPEKLSIHSNKCKEATELKYKVLTIGTTLTSLINTAYDLKNQLNTNAAIQKNKMKQWGAYEIAGYIDSPVLTSKKKPVMKHFFFLEDDAMPVQEHKRKAISIHGDNLNGEVRELKTQDDNAIKRESGTGEGDDKAKGRRFSHRGSISIKIPKKAETPRESLLDEEKMNKFNDEFSKAMLAFKKILQYGQSFRDDLEGDDGDEITNKHLEIKNEITILHHDILDKKISEYLRKFSDTVEEYVLIKQKYVNKKAEVDELNSETENSESSYCSSPNKRASFRNRRIVARHVTVLSSIYASSVDETSDLSSEKKHSSFSLNVSMNRNSPVKGNNSGILSRFAQQRKQNEVSDSQDSSRQSSLSHSSEDNDSSDFSSSSKPSSKKSSFSQATSSPLSGSPTIPVVFRKITDSPIHQKDSPMYRYSRFRPSDDSSRFGSPTKKGSESLANSDEGEKQEEEIKGEIQEEEVKQKVPMNSRTTTSEDSDTSIKVLQTGKGSGKKEKRKKSLEGMRNLEDIGALLAKKFPSLTKPNADPSPSNALKNNFMDSTPKKNDDFKNIKSSIIKGYYSDTTRGEKRKTNSKKKDKVGIEDFDFIKQLGQGAYGKIYLVKKKATGDKYAMKILDFAGVELAHNKLGSLQAEQDIYASIKGDWVVKALYTFSYQNSVCFVLELMIGGDFIGLLNQVGCFEESVARFYFAELVLAVESLHHLGIIHRDLKPDNILLDGNGHLKLTDFGLSEKGVNMITKISRERREAIRCSSLQMPQGILESLVNDGGEFKGRAGGKKNTLKDTLKRNLMKKSLIRSKKNEEEVIFSFLEKDEKAVELPKRGSNGQVIAKKEVHRIIGTPDYIAPEIIRGENCNNKGVDIWSLGVILYEFLIGVPPFNDESVDKIFTNIEERRIEWPPIGYEEDQLTPEAQDLIERLLNPSTFNRLNINQIKQHDFFKGFEWENVKAMKAPIVPQKKEEKSPETSMKLQSIFKGPNEGENLKTYRKNQNAISTFDMKRVDLLHQLNEQTYDKFKKHNEDDNKKTH